MRAEQQDVNISDWLIDLFFTILKMILFPLLRLETPKAKQSNLQHINTGANDYRNHNFKDATEPTLRATWVNHGHWYLRWGI